MTEPKAGGDPGTENDPQGQGDPTHDGNGPGNGGDGNKQSEIDRRVSEAVKTAEARVRKELAEKERQEREEAERRKLEEDKKFEELLKKEQAEKNRLLVERERSKALAEAGLTSLDPVFSLDLNTPEGISEGVPKLAEAIKAHVEEEIKKRMTPDPSPPGGKGSGGGAGKDYSKMSLAEFRKIREKEKGLR